MSLWKQKTSDTGILPVVRSEFWSYKFEFRKQQIKRATRFKNREDAKRAMANHRMALEREWSERGTTLLTDGHFRRRDAKVATTIREILQAFADPRAPLESKLRTRINCGNALRNALRRVRGDSTDVEALSVSVINPAMVEQYFSDATLRANAATDQGRAASIKRTAASVLRQAMAVFSPRAARWYRSRGLQIPDMAPIREAVQACKFTRVPRHEYAPASEAVIERALAAWETLEDRNMFLVVGLALSFGLRKGEIGQAKWGWLIQRDGRPLLSTTDVMVKDHTGRLNIRALNPFYATMVNRVEKEAWRGADEDFILTGTEYFRVWKVFNMVNAWLRHHGFSMQKGVHELRALSGGAVAIMDDIYSASLFLRHKSVGMTQTHYGAYVSQSARTNRELLKVSWA